MNLLSLKETIRELVAAKHLTKEQIRVALKSMFNELPADDNGLTNERNLRIEAQDFVTSRDKLLKSIIEVCGVAKPDTPMRDLHGHDLTALGIDAMWLIEKQRLTLDDAAKVIEMFMPNVAKCFGIDVGALNRTMMNIEMVKRGKPPAPEMLGGMIDDTPEINLTIEALRRENFELRQTVRELTGDNEVLREMVMGDDR